MPHKIGLAIGCLHTSAVLYLLLGAALFLLVSVDDHPLGLLIPLFMLAFCVALAIGIEVVVGGLRKRRFWAWVAGLCIFGMYVPSLFLPLGALGLWGLLDGGSRAQFGINVGVNRG